MSGMDTMTQNIPSACNNAPDVDFPAFKKRFTETEKLYHYTIFEKAVKILCNKQLRYSKLKDLNDINESYRPVYVAFDGNTFPDDKTFKDLENAIQRFGQISFSVDEKKRKGFDIPAMWAHYAQKGNGVCLVFDKGKLEQQLKPYKQKEMLDFQKIRYKREGYDPSIILPSADMEECINYLFTKRKEIFFEKTADWSYEQEYRVIRKVRGTKDVFLNVKNTFLAVILYNAPDIKPTDHVFASVQYAAIQKIAGNLPVCCYASFREERNLSCDGECIWSLIDHSNEVLDV